MRYNVRIEETKHWVISVAADNKDEAKDFAWDRVKDTGPAVKGWFENPRFQCRHHVVGVLGVDKTTTTEEAI